jgi:hypothetical protein
VVRLTKEKAELDEMLLTLDQDERRIAAVDQWQKSEIVWLEELYNLTARFPDVTKLRLTELTAEPLQLAPPQPGRLVEATKPVAQVKLKGLSTDDGPLSTLMRELVKDAARVNPKQIAPNTTGTSRRQFAQQWSTSYQLTHETPNRKAFVATPPDRTRIRGRGRGGPDPGDMTDGFLNGGVP